MPYTQEVDPIHIVETVMSAINSAKHEVIATMDVGEELQHPLPDAYYRLLAKRAESGIRIIRIGFGAKEELHAFEQLGSHPEKNYRFIPITNGTYQRMILVDQQLLFFANESLQDGRHFFQSTDRSTIERYQEYIRSFDRS